LFDEENARQFGGAVRARIGWSVGAAGQVRHSIRLGSFSPRHRLIRVHPALDRPSTPVYVVRFVVFHEMLHGAIGARLGDRAARRHGPDFREAEKSHPDYVRAQAWIAQHLQSLLRF
jgi:predicted metal-dependent hydrolase